MRRQYIYHHIMCCTHICKLPNIAIVKYLYKKQHGLLEMLLNTPAVFLGSSLYKAIWVESLRI